MTRRAHFACVDCGGAKAPGAHFLRSRCKPCGDAFRVQMSAANAAVCRAVARGTLPRAKTKACTDCGKAAFDWDHRDYSKPLDVEPVCRACNIKRGPALYVPARKAPKVAA